jgi:flagellar biosynthesis/type III secretory pathway chaperone
MSKYWEFLAQCLRTELADYGGLLHLFEAQQRSLFGRDPESVLRFANEIEAQARLISESRTRREEAVAAFAQENNRPLNSTLRALLPLIEADARPLLEALIAEVNTLLHRVRRFSRNNHTLLARAVEVHQETLQHLRPHAFTKTYSPAGRLAVATSHPPVKLRAAG